MKINDLLISNPILTGSNKVFHATICDLDNNLIESIYKPKLGEKPLIDFSPGTLYKREFAAYLVSQTLGWPNIPETLIYEGPHGIGSVQKLVKYKKQENYFTLLNRFPDDLLKIAIFDIIVNNADRKGGHFLLDYNDILWSIDHGLTFHHIFKVRTVIFDFEGKKIPKDIINDLIIFLEQLNQRHSISDNINSFISDIEYQALINRLNILIKNPYVPHLNPYYNVPWPLI
ncbi:MAG: phosphatidylinositol kinase [Chloroflexi bacterium]|nr:phosphatidylinositol kinase [Chloroflexota bacterium]|tara:strand:- start:1433 stop:2122 length:690 start_codon:yes stop_codon:yes gene_type:complete